MRRSTSNMILAIAFLICIAATSVASGALIFQGLGHLPGSPQSSAAFAVSADGLTIVGGSGSGADNGIHPVLERSFRWTAAGGMQPLNPEPPLPGYPDAPWYNTAYGTSGDGSVVVGFSYEYNDEYGSSAQAYRWTAGGGMQRLAAYPESGFATGVSADGSVIVGFGSSGPFRWTAANGVQPLSGSNTGHAAAVSASGNVIVGHDDNNSQAFRWTPESGMQLLGFLPGGANFSYASAVSADGTVVVGVSNSALADPGVMEQQFFRWTESDGMQSLGVFPGYTPGHSAGYAFGVSADGSTVVGRAEDVALGSNYRSEAFIWHEGDGIRSLRDVLVDEYGLDLNGWTLSAANAITPDGSTIVGYGINTSGQSEAWIAIIPEPAALPLLALGGFVLLGGRNCRTRLERSPQLSEIVVDIDKNEAHHA